MTFWKKTAHTKVFKNDVAGRDCAAEQQILKKLCPITAVGEEKGVPAAELMNQLRGVIQAEGGSKA